MTYKEQLLNPKWQKKRFEILERDKYTCQICLDTETTLHVHHNFYDETFQTKAWEYPDYAYKTLCCDCHKFLTEHLNECGNDKEFDVMRVKNEGKKDALFVYNNGKLEMHLSQVEKSINFYENTTHKIVQFLINNWLKNG